MTFTDACLHWFTRYHFAHLGDVICGGHKAYGRVKREARWTPFHVLKHHYKSLPEAVASILQYLPLVFRCSSRVDARNDSEYPKGNAELLITEAINPYLQTFIKRD